MYMAQNDLRLTSTNHGTTISSIVLKRYSSSSSTHSIHLKDWVILDWEFLPRNGVKRFISCSCQVKAALHKAVVAQGQREIAMATAAQRIERNGRVRRMGRKEQVRQVQLQLGRELKLLNRHKHPLNHTCNRNLHNTNNPNKPHIQDSTLSRFHPRAILQQTFLNQN